MSDILVHIVDSQIVDVVVDRVYVTIFFLGGTSLGVLEEGDSSPEMYDIQMEFPDDDVALSVRSMLVPWYQKSEPVTIKVTEDGSAVVINQISDQSLNVFVEEPI